MKNKLRFRMYNRVVVPFWNVTCRGTPVVLSEEDSTVIVTMCQGMCKLWTIRSEHWYAYGRGGESLHVSLANLETLLRLDGQFHEADRIHQLDIEARI